MIMMKYKLRYEGNENISYTEINLQKDRREKVTKPSDEFGKKLETLIKQLMEGYPDKKINVELTS